MRTDSGRRERFAVSALVFGVATPVTYVLELLLEWVRGEHGDPRLILGLLHTAYYWRVLVAFWWGGVVAIIVYALLSRGRDPARAARAVGIAACVLLPLGMIASWRFP